MRCPAIVATLALAGCQTVFTGAPKVTDGPKGCRAACDAWGMDLAGMVKMGEYSDGCICQVRPGTPAPATPPGKPSADASGAPGPGGPQAIAGVWVQMQAAAAAAAQQSAEATRRTAQSPAPYVPGSPPGTPGWGPGLP
jgi:hypothetical protein